MYFICRFYNTSICSFLIAKSDLCRIFCILEETKTYYPNVTKLMPPSTVKISPHIASLFTRKSTASAISSGSIILLIALACPSCFFSCSFSIPHIGVATLPGATAFTKIFGANSFARFFV